MKTLNKVLIYFVLGCCFIVIGISLGGFRESWQITSNWKINAHQISDITYFGHNGIENLDLELHNAQVDIVYRDDIENVKVDFQNVYEGTKVYEKNSTLYIMQPHYWGSKTYTKSMIRIDIPIELSFQNIKLEMNVGEVDVNGLKGDNFDLDIVMGEVNIEDINVQELNIDTVMGQLNADQIDVHRELKLDTVMANSSIALKGQIDDYIANVDVVLGGVDIGNDHFGGITDHKNQNGQAHKKMKIDCFLGEVIIEVEDEGYAETFI